MSKIAVIIKTGPNRLSLRWVINSVIFSLKNHDYRLYIYDEEKTDEWKKDYYKSLEDQGHFIHISPTPVSVCVARNYLISSLRDEDFVLRIDDDFELGGEFSIDRLLSVLSVSDIDFCSEMERQIGSGRTRSGYTRLSSGYIHLNGHSHPIIEMIPDPVWTYEKIEGVRYARADYMRNLILIKRSCFDQVKWENRLNFDGEHEDFYLSLKKAGFSGAFTPDSIHLHREDLKILSVNVDEDSNVYNEQSASEIKEEKNLFREKWGGSPVFKLRKMWGKRLGAFLSTKINIIISKARKKLFGII